MDHLLGSLGAHMKIRKGPDKTYSKEASSSYQRSSSDRSHTSQLMSYVCTRSITYIWSSTPESMHACMSQSVHATVYWRRGY